MYAALSKVILWTISLSVTVFQRMDDYFLFLNQPLLHIQHLLNDSNTQTHILTVFLFTNKWKTINLIIRNLYAPVHGSGIPKRSITKHLHTKKIICPQTVFKVIYRARYKQLLAFACSAGIHKFVPTKLMVVNPVHAERVNLLVRLFRIYLASNSFDI